MGSVDGRARRLESVISICILAVLCLIGAGILIKQSRVDTSRSGISTIAAPKSETHFELSSLAPAGFETPSEMEVYNSENLYEKINGKAPLYTESGFELLSTQRFASKIDKSLMIELFVYNMGTPKNAFSVYSIQKRAEAKALPDTQFGYKTGNALYFARGKYYIELVGFSESDELFEAIKETAGKFQTQLTVSDDTKIAELSLFPSENIVAGSIKLYMAGAFGFEGLTETFTVQYQFGDETVTAFLSRRANPEEAKNIAQSYYKFLIDNGGSARQTASEILEDKVIDFYGTTEIVFAAGSFTAGIHEAENQQSAEKLAVMLVDRLK